MKVFAILSSSCIVYEIQSALNTAEDMLNQCTGDKPVTKMKLLSMLSCGKVNNTHPQGPRRLHRMFKTNGSIKLQLS